MRHKLTEKAKSDLENITLYTVENFGLEQADSYVSGLLHSFLLLEENPYMGTAFDETRRRFVYRQHHIYYRITPNYILVVEIRNARQAPPDA